jgi:hypothetical protein
MEGYTMKKLMVLSLVVIYSLLGLARDPGDTYFVSNKVVLCQKMSVGVSKVRYIDENGIKQEALKKDIKGYSLNGKLFQKQMLYENNKATGKEIFMEKVSERDGYTLYKYSTFDWDLKDVATFYYVYKDTKFTYPITAANCYRVFLYFGVKVDKIYVEN